MYRLYAQKQQGGWDMISTKQSYDLIKQSINTIKQDGYYSYMIIKNEGNGDEIVESNKLQEYTERQRVNKFKDTYKVNKEDNSTKPKPSNRAKRKEELRKLTQDYIDR